MIDDIRIFGESSEEHDARVRAVSRRLEDNGSTLNIEKCEFAKSSIMHGRVDYDCVPLPRYD